MIDNGNVIDETITWISTDPVAAAITDCVVYSETLHFRVRCTCWLGRTKQAVKVHNIYVCHSPLRPNPNFSS